MLSVDSVRVSVTLHRMFVHIILVRVGSLSGHLLHITWQSTVKKMLIFRFVGIFEYIILLMLILFLDMCPNSYGLMQSL